MPKRRRYATRAELVRLMLDDALGAGWPVETIEAHAEAALAALAKLGVSVDVLVKIEVYEPSVTIDETSGWSGV